MVFSSLTFIGVFLPLTLVLYFAVQARLRNALLLMASLLFYAWGETFFTFVMLASIGLNYVLGLVIWRFRGRMLSHVALAIAVVGNLGLLAAFKYANFLVDNLNALLAFINISPFELEPVHLPIGISFFTFQALSYVIDVYRQDGEVQLNPLHLALYISLFPQLIAGPIVRYQHIADQLKHRIINAERFAHGIRRFLIGLGKKVLLANTFAYAADDIFGLNPDFLSPGLAWVGILSYAFQIYFDFSGYSDMAIGLGHMFGFEFLENFQWPYIAQSIQEFWRRWHISLSTWFRDYLYIPLGGSRRGSFRTHTNLVIVFLLCGLWHGASWTFVLWGMYHGIFLVAERTRFGRWISGSPRPLRHVYCLMTVLVGWVFFRAETLQQALAFLGAMVGHSGPEAWPELVHKYLNGELLLATVIGIVGSTPLVRNIGSRMAERLVTDSQASPVARLAFSGTELLAYGTIMGLCFVSLAAGTHNPFIYFRF